jgi:hypothetical protein
MRWPVTKASRCRQALWNPRFSSVSPNKSLQRSVTHKVLGRGRPSVFSAAGAAAPACRQGRRAAAELNR